MRWLRRCSRLLVLGVAWPLKAAAQGTPHVVTASADPCLNVRHDHNASAQSFECLPPGTRVMVLSAVPYWREIRLADGRTGWAAKKFLAADTTAPAPPPDSAVTIPATAWLEVHVVDVGQGDGIWIHTFDDGIAGNGVFEGRNIVIDGGPDASDAKNEMRKYLEGRAHHDAIIDALIISHPHDDHYPGAEGLLRHFEIADIYEPGYPKEGVSWSAVLGAINAETIGGQPSRIMHGRSEFAAPEWGRELEAEFLWSYPGSDSGLGSRKNTVENNASIVLRLTYGDHVFLFMGDAEGKDRGDSPATPRYVEKFLLDSLGAGGLKTTVLKLGHHGSETSSTVPFIQAVNPDVIIASSGRRSFSGVFLPDSTVLARYCARNPNVKILRTDQDDAALQRTSANDQDGDHIVIRTNGALLEITVMTDGVESTVRGCGS